MKAGQFGLKHADGAGVVDPFEVIYLTEIIFINPESELPGSQAHTSWSNFSSQLTQFPKFCQH